MLNAPKTHLATPAAVAFYKAAQATMGDLASRWADERGFEDLKDYQPILQQIATQHGCTVLRMISRPFGCMFQTGDRFFTLKFTLSGSYSYHRVSAAQTPTQKHTKN